MTDTAQLKKLYMLLRWYDCLVQASRPLNPPEEDAKLARQLEKEMHELQKKLTSTKKRKASKDEKRR